MSKVLTGNDDPFLYEDLYRRWKENVKGKLETFPKPLPTRIEPEHYFKIIKVGNIELKFIIGRNKEKKFCYYIVCIILEYSAIWKYRRINGNNF